MNTENIKNKNSKAGCTDFESAFKGFKDMCGSMSEFCVEKDSSIDCSGMKEKMMEMCSGMRNKNKSDKKS